MKEHIHIIQDKLGPEYRVLHKRTAYGWLVGACPMGQPGNKAVAVELHKLPGPSRYQRWSVQRHYDLLYTGPRYCGRVERYLGPAVQLAADELQELVRRAF